MRRMKVLLAVVAAMTMLMVMSVPAMADDFGRNCFPFCNDHHNDFDHHDFDDDGFFINDFDNFDNNVEVDDCDLLGFDGDGNAIFACDVDFD
jgi:hypothetical protein